MRTNRFSVRTKYVLLLLAVLAHSCLLAQKSEYAVLLIPAALKENANAVVRDSREFIEIQSQDRMTSRAHTAITVLNEYGLSSLDLTRHYSKATKITHIEAKVYDAMGNLIKSFKKKDFKDVSVGDGFSIFNDDRMLYLDYTPVTYPFTMVMESGHTTSNTATIPRWSALAGYFVSTQNDEIHITYPENLGFGYKEVNFDGRDIVRTASAGSLKYVATNIPAMKGEAKSPGFYKIAPIAYFRLDKFNLEGVRGQATSWKEFGKWYNDELLAGTTELPDETVSMVKQLAGDEKDPVKVARKLYAYVQDRTRYVSIQVGIGGFKPMNASDVDKLGYGDCKALSNYMRALLAAAGIPSYFTLVYSGDESRRSLQGDFVSVQGNHAILALPVNGEYIWLECTSQVSPFGFQGCFTDGRDVLVVKPDGGEIVKTKMLLEKDNSLISRGNYAILADGGFSGSVTMVATGAKYDETYLKERLSAKDRESYYKEYFATINSLRLEKIAFANDREKVELTQSIALSAPGYASASGVRLLFPVNAFHQMTDTPKRYRTRQHAFGVERGYFEQDQVTVALPDGYEIEALPDAFELKGIYGEYRSKVTRNPDNTLMYERTLLIKDGFYPSSGYEEYRLFCEQVARCDNAKVVLVKKT